MRVCKCVLVRVVAAAQANSGCGKARRAGVRVKREALAQTMAGSGPPAEFRAAVAAAERKLAGVDTLYQR